MKYILLILISFSSFQQLFAGDSLFNNANKKYENGNYTEAIKLYNKLIDEDFKTASIYYNLGNSYYRTKDYVLAKVNFEKAYKLNPSDKDIKHNIKITNQFFVDEFKQPEFNANIIDKSVMI